MIIEEKDGKIVCRCASCGGIFEVNEPKGTFRELFRAMIAETPCDACVAAETAKRALEAQKEVERDFTRSLPESLVECGFSPAFAALDEPPKREVAVWIWKNRERNILLGGATGAGKTTGATFAAKAIAKARKSVWGMRYVLRDALIAEYVDALKNCREEVFWKCICGRRLLIVDEMVGTSGYGKLSKSGQELFSRLADAVYDGRMRGKIWMLGNFSQGSLAELFDEPKPLMRRLTEKFKAGWIEGDTVKEMAI